MAETLEGDFLIVEGTIAETEVQCRTGRAVIDFGFR